MSDAMEAGRELDALVAEKVMGWVWLCMLSTGSDPLLMRPERVAELLPEYVAHNRVDGYSGVLPQSLPRYSTDIAAAWEVVAKLESMGRYVELSNGSYNQEWHRERGRWLVCVSPFEPLGDGAAIEVFADTAPHAICLAALKAVGAA